MDLDFVVRFAADDRLESRLIEVLGDLGYELLSNTFVHKAGNPFTVEFPKGPASIGDEVLKEFDTLRDGKRVLVIVTPTDCIRDRLAHYFYWNDRSALAAAIGVAKAQKAHVDFRLIRTWATQLAEESTIEYPDIPTKTRHFLTELHELTN